MQPSACRAQWRSGSNEGIGERSAVSGLRWFRRRFTGALLWPVVILHGILTMLLARYFTPMHHDLR